MKKSHSDFDDTASLSRDNVPARWEWHRQTLLRLRADLVGERDERNIAFRAALERGGTDLGDAASEERDNRDLIAELCLEEAELREIEAALERIQRGTYGRCEATGQQIGAARLRAVPWTRFSMEAAIENEIATEQHST